MRVNRKPVPTTGDEQTERAILAIILASDPMALTIPELTREFGGDKDKVIQAICGLADYGLLEFKGAPAESLRPTAASRRCHRLDDW